MAFVRAMIEAYARYGRDPATALQRARIDRSDLRREDACITGEQMMLFSEIAMRELDDETLGWFSRRLPWGSYGLLCRASIGAPNLAVALKRWCRHHNLLVDDVRHELRLEDGAAIIEIVEQRPLDPRLRSFCLLSLLRYVHGFACWAIDSRIPLRRVRFPYPPPPHHAAYGLMFPGQVQFGAARTSMAFDAEYLDLPLRRDEAALQTMLRRALLLTVFQYRHDRLFVQRVRTLLPEHHTADAVARELNLSVRTLHRRLRDEGTSLQALKDRARHEVAAQLLLTGRPLKQVAALAGFRNEKSFSRAFSAWTGQSPQAYRRSRAA